MIFGAVICFIIMALAIEDGTIDVAVITGVAGATFSYFAWRNSFRQEKKRWRKEKLERAKKRFGNSTFVSSVLSDLQRRNWEVLPYSNDYCQVLTDRIVTQYKTYLYVGSGFEFKTLSTDSCEELAIYLGSFCSKSNDIRPITYKKACVGPGYSGSIGLDGSVSLTRDADEIDVTIGWSVKKK